MNICFTLSLTVSWLNISINFNWHIQVWLTLVLKILLNEMFDVKTSSLTPFLLTSNIFEARNFFELLTYHCLWVLLMQLGTFIFDENNAVIVNGLENKLSKWFHLQHAHLHTYTWCPHAWCVTWWQYYLPHIWCLTMTGCLTEMFMFPKSWVANITSFTASDKSTYSASELESDTLFCGFNCQ